MTVRFSKHAIQRLNKRFAKTRFELLEIIKSGLLEGKAKPSRRSRWVLEGIIDGRLVKVVYVEQQANQYVIVTLVLCD